MAYITGGIITALDYNDLIAQVNEIYADLPVGQRVNDTYGYGQTDPLLVEVAPDAIIGAEEWNYLYDVVKTIGFHQRYYNDSNAPPPLFLDDKISGVDLIEAYNELQGIIDNLIIGRLTEPETQITQLGISTRTTSWDGIIQHKFSIHFGTYDQARYFFNSGSYIEIFSSLDPDNVNRPIERAWRDSLDAVGNVRYNWETTHADAGRVLDVGFYRGTTTDEQLLLEKGVLENGAQTISSNYYDSDYYRIYIKFGGTNPSLKNVLEFDVVYESEIDGEAIAGDLTSIVRVRTSVELDVIKPSYVLDIGLDQGP